MKWTVKRWDLSLDLIVSRVFGGLMLFPLPGNACYVFLVLFYVVVYFCAGMLQSS